MKEETKNIVVCPKHGNKEYDVKPPHYCKNKIGEGCNCICTCHLEEKKCPAQGTKECEEDHDGFCYYCERNMPSPSDKTWELGKLVGKTVYSVSESDEVVEISFRNQETRADKITMRFYSELTSATIKAKEQQRRNIGMMRQWLNEDRITDVKKMVSNEELAYWLNLEEPSK